MKFINKCVDCNEVTLASKMTWRSYPDFKELPIAGPVCRHCQTIRNHDLDYQSKRREYQQRTESQI